MQTNPTKVIPMSSAQSVLAINDDFPIRTGQPVHSGKVRSVYWLTEEDSARLIRERGYEVPSNTPLAVMIISDRLSAFDCIWRAEGGMNGVPGKGAALNAISNHWFKLFKQNGLADSHILEVPHPLVWIVQKASPVMIEAIARNYITGSMWRTYAQGERIFCGIEMNDDLKKDQKLANLLITPSTKGVLRNIPNVPETDDVNVSREDIESNFELFKLAVPTDVDVYERLLVEGFRLIEAELSKVGQIFVDTKFEFGYVNDLTGHRKLIYMDEVGTPDSSRMWDANKYANGEIVENSKEGFRQKLLEYVEDSDILLNKDRMDERAALAEAIELPKDFLLDVSKTYLSLTKKITGSSLVLSSNPREEVIRVLTDEFGLID